MSTTAPVVLFVYNRPDLTLQTLAGLQNNNLAADSLLIIYADGPKPYATEDELQKIELTRQAIRQHPWCKQTIIRESPINKGLANSVISGVTEVLNDYENVIVLEDDLVTAKGFLQYMNDALTKYAGVHNVMQVSGFNFPIKTIARNKSYFLPFITSWGWGTWRRAWKFFDTKATGYEVLKNDEKLRYAFNLQGAYPYSDMIHAQMEVKSIDSWAIRWWWSVFRQNGLVLYPDRTLIQNIGFGKGATHTQLENNNLISVSFDLNYAVTSFPEQVIVERDKFKKITEFLSGENEYGKDITRVNFLKKFLRKFRLRNRTNWRN